MEVESLGTPEMPEMPGGIGWGVGARVEGAGVVVVVVVVLVFVLVLLDPFTCSTVCQLVLQYHHSPTRRESGKKKSK